jgi:hypothetical protein
LLHPVGDHGGVEPNDLIFGMLLAVNQAAILGAVARKRKFHDKRTDLNAFIRVNRGPEFITAARQKAGQ